MHWVDCFSVRTKEVKLLKKVMARASSRRMPWFFPRVKWFPYRWGDDKVTRRLIRLPCSAHCFHRICKSLSHFKQRFEPLTLSHCIQPKLGSLHSTWSFGALHRWCALFNSSLNQKGHLQWSSHLLQPHAVFKQMMAKIPLAVSFYCLVLDQLDLRVHRDIILCLH